MADTKKDRELSESEIAKRRDAGLRALLKMPPKPHDQIAGKGKPKPKSKPTGKKGGAKDG